MCAIRPLKKIVAESSEQNRKAKVEVYKHNGNASDDMWEA